MSPTVQIRVDFAGSNGIPHTFLRVTHPDGQQVEYGLVPAKPLSNVGRNSVFCVLRRMSLLLSGAIITKRVSCFIRRIFSFAAIIFLGGTLVGCGEKYTDEGHALDRAMTRELISRGICKDFIDCNSKLPMYGEHGNHVNFNAYGIKAENRPALAALFEFVVIHGIEITKGVPIAIRVYPKPREEYGTIVFPSKPAIKLEIKE